MSVELTVVGSINLDLVARVDRLPRPGETLTGTDFERFPGGKGANQAVAAAKLGARVKMIGAVGADAFADDALAGLRHAGVELHLQSEDVTGVALILVTADGENQIVVIPGANARIRPQSPGGAVLGAARGARRSRLSPPQKAPTSSRSTLRRHARSTSSRTC